MSNIIRRNVKVSISAKKLESGSKMPNLQTFGVDGIAYNFFRSVSL